MATRSVIVHILPLVAFILVFAPARRVSGEIYTFKDDNGVIHLANRPDGGIVPITTGSAKTWNIKKPSSSRKRPVSDRRQYDKLIRQAANRYNIGFGLIKAVIHAESGFNSRAVSHKGARGLMQLMPGTARQLGVRNSFDPRQNIFGGTRYLKEMLDRYGQNIKLSLAAYNAGPEAVDRSGGIPPYSETRGYIRRVLRLMRRYGDAGSSGGKIYKVIKNGQVLLTNRPLP
ncbi:MAG: transglycosylase SLT domain-containing protein [Gemmatimonadota bacterium]|nr:transglycosylase SLT domain-containing protein [Gemmatimonadota bacterium]